MFSLKVPPPLPWPHIMKMEKKDIVDDSVDTPPKGKGEDVTRPRPSPPEGVEGETEITRPTPGPRPGPGPSPGPEEETGKTTEQVLSDTLNALRLPKIERDWKKCISTIEKVINIQPSQKEYNNPMVLRNIENYKDRLGKDLYECKVNLKRKEEEDKLLAQRKREKAQEEFEKRFEAKYNLRPQGQQPQPQSQPQQLKPQPQQPQPSFGIDMERGQGDQREQGDKGEQGEQGDKGEKEEQGEKGEKGFIDKIKSYFVDDDEEDEDEEDEEKEKEEKEETREEMIDAINLYLKSQDPSMPQTVHLDDIKGIDNIIENYKELIENYDNLDEKFSKYKEKQRMRNFKDNSLVNDKEETIENLTNVILKLEKRLKEYKRNAEKKFIAQNELHDEELKDLEKDKNKESREVHKFMQGILNERVEAANTVIKGLTEETEARLKDKTRTRSRSKKEITDMNPLSKLSFTKDKKKKKKKTKKKAKKSKSKSKKGA